MRTAIWLALVLVPLSFACATAPPVTQRSASAPVTRTAFAAAGAATDALAPPKVREAALTGPARRPNMIRVEADSATTVRRASPAVVPSLTPIAVARGGQTVIQVGDPLPEPANPAPVVQATALPLNELVSGASEPELASLPPATNVAAAEPQAASQPVVAPEPLLAVTDSAPVAARHLAPALELAAGLGAVDLLSMAQNVPTDVRALAVIIENHPNARPQHGLGVADVVYEAMAEGGIPRFMALYLTGDAEIAGPVRSLRHYFAWIAGEYAADVVHVGSSPQGYAWRDAMNLGYLDDTFGDPGFWRSSDRYAPHNDYTNTIDDRQYLVQRGRQQPGSWGGLEFRAAGALPYSGLAAPAAELTYPGGYWVRWDWNANLGRYERSMVGQPHVDALNGQRITASAVIVQFVETWLIPGDTKGRLDMALEGEGDYVIFVDGVVGGGRWVKPSIADVTHWYGPDGSPILLPPGPIWVQVAPLNATLAY